MNIPVVWTTEEYLYLLLGGKDLGRPPQDNEYAQVPGILKFLTKIKIILKVFGR